jgi:hypothetical protein
MDSCPEVIHHWYQWHLSVGMCSVILAVIAVFAPIGWENQSSRSKSARTVLLFVFLALELHAIRRDAIERSEDQAHTVCVQMEHFRQIGERIEEANRQSREQYDETIRQVTDVLKTANEVAGLSKKNLENLTGAEAFAYVAPNLKMYRGNIFSVRLYNDSEQLLSGVTLKIARALGECPADRPLSQCYLQTDDGLFKPLEMGTIGPHDSLMVPRPIDPEPAQGTVTHYRITVTAQNGTALEHLWFRPTSDGQRYEYKLIVLKKSSGKRKKNGRYETDRDGNLIETIKEIDWTEPAKALDNHR